MEKRIIIIDGNSLLNRAYYAIQNPMMTREGLYTQGIYGFLSMLEKMKAEHPSGYLVVTFDMKGPTFRHEEYAEYKAGRKKMPPELAMQLPLLKDVLDAMNIKRLEMEGFEADDIIGTISVKAEEEGLMPLIITGDKDELQLATDVTKVMITKRGISQFELYDREVMIEKYGFPPELFIDYKGLMGDQSDNIPGLPGVGEKTAQKLVMEYGTVENLLEHTEELKGKLKKTVEENATLALMSKRLATINTAIPMEVDFDEYILEKPDHDKLVEMYTKLEFNSFLRKMGTGLSEKEQEEANTFKELPTEPVMIRKASDLRALSSQMKEDTYAVLKTFGNDDHKDIPMAIGASILIGNKYFYVDLSTEEVKEELVKILNKKKPKFMGHDLKKDYYLLMNLGVRDFETAFDTAIAQYVIDSGRSNYALTTLAQEYFRTNIQDEKEFAGESGQLSLLDDAGEKYSAYGLKWCALVAQLAIPQGEEIRREELEDVFRRVELPLIQVMAYMEYTGFAVDKQVLTDIGKDISARVEKLTAQIHDLAGETFNIKSPTQLGPILFEKLGLPAGKKTKRGYSTSAEILERLRDEHPIIDLILEYRTLTKLSGTYVDGLIPLIHKNGKIHAHFNQTIAATGRISSSDPNLQNIPIRQEEGRKIRKAFVPSSREYILLSADYSQIELRVLAHLSGDPLLIDAFNGGEDIHRATAARVLGVPDDQITIDERSRAKAVNFGVIYGMSAFGLSTNLNITRQEADEYIKSYFAKHEKVKEYMDGQVAFCKANGYVRTILGRKRIINEISASNYMVRQLGERLAMNSPIQGSAADIIKIAMVNIQKALSPYKSRLILQVHDELIVETHLDEVDAVEKVLVESMEDAMELKVKLAVDVNMGSNWFELK